MKEILYEQIKQANETIKTTPIKEKNYAEVNQRIKAFRMVYPTGIIETEMVSNENGICIFKATVGYRQENEMYKLATGTAYEKENSTFINKTSYIENCETSAVGRALGMAGFGIDVSLASAEEVQNAQLNQEKPKTQKKETNRQKLIKLCKERNFDINEIAVQYNLTPTSTEEDYKKAIIDLDGK